MKHKLLSLVLALGSILALGMPVFAGSAEPILSKNISVNVAVTPYAYYLFDPKESFRYVNTVYCETNAMSLTADNGELYHLTDTAPLIDTSLFLGSVIKVNTNPQLVKEARVEKGYLQNGGKPCFAIRLEENAVLKRIPIDFTETYTAKEDVKLEARQNGTNETVVLTVKQGVKLSVRHSLLIDYDALNRLEYKPKFNVPLDALLDNTRAAGVDGDVMTPSTKYDYSLTWKAGGQICAAVDETGGMMASQPKLSARWDSPKLLKMFSKEGNAFIRSFKGNQITGSVQLMLTNPFLTVDGEETMPHKDIIIYEYADGKLKDITKSFRYTQDEDGFGAFQMNVSSQLGTYIISDHRIK